MNSDLIYASVAQQIIEIIETCVEFSLLCKTYLTVSKIRGSRHKSVIPPLWSREKTMENSFIKIPGERQLVRCRYFLKKRNTQPLPGWNFSEHIFADVKSADTSCNSSIPHFIRYGWKLFVAATQNTQIFVSFFFFFFVQSYTRHNSCEFNKGRHKWKQQRHKSATWLVERRKLILVHVIRQCLQFTQYDWLNDEK